jgi:hypothetical protein
MMGLHIRLDKYLLLTNLTRTFLILKPERLFPKFHLPKTEFRNIEENYPINMKR